MPQHSKKDRPTDTAKTAEQSDAATTGSNLGATRNRGDDSLKGLRFTSPLGKREYYFSPTTNRVPDLKFTNLEQSISYREVKPSPTQTSRVVSEPVAATTLSPLNENKKKTEPQNTPIKPAPETETKYKSFIKWLNSEEALGQTNFTEFLQDARLRAPRDLHNAINFLAMRRLNNQDFALLFSACSRSGSLLLALVELTNSIKTHQKLVIEPKELVEKVKPGSLPSLKALLLV